MGKPVTIDAGEVLANYTREWPESERAQLAVGLRALQDYELRGAPENWIGVVALYPTGEVFTRMVPRAEAITIAHDLKMRAFDSITEASAPNMLVIFVIMHDRHYVFEIGVRPCTMDQN